MDDEKVIVDDEPRDEGAEEMTEEDTHRYDEYEGLARRIDDMFARFDEINVKLDAIKAGVDGFVDAGAIVDEAGEDAVIETIEDIIDAADAFDAFDDLDFKM